MAAILVERTTLATFGPLAQVELMSPVHEDTPTWIRQKWNNFKIAVSQTSLAWFCCDGTEDGQYVYDLEIRRKISEQMLVRRQHLNQDDITSVMNETLETTGYDLGHARRIYRDHANVNTTNAAQAARFMVTDDVPETPPLQVAHSENKVIPKFAAAVVMALRSKLGRLAMNEANMIVLEREYGRMCRAHYVRECDVVFHQQHVMNAYFGEGSVDRVGLSRARVSKWKKWVYNDPGPEASRPLAC